MLNSIARNSVQVKVIINICIIKATINATFGSTSDEDTQPDITEIFYLFEQIEDTCGAICVLALV